MSPISMSRAHLNFAGSEEVQLNEGLFFVNKGCLGLNETFGPVASKEKVFVH